MEIRLDKATRLLANSDSKVIDIAFQCGFCHLSQFSSKFKKRYGTTPALWRRRNLSQRMSENQSAMPIQTVAPQTTVTGYSQLKNVKSGLVNPVIPTLVSHY